MKIKKKKERAEKAGKNMARFFAHQKKNPKTNKYGLPIRPEKVRELTIEKEPSEAYKNKHYWALPENVRKAIDLA